MKSWPSGEEPPLTMLGAEWALCSPCQESRVDKSAGRLSVMSRFPLIYIQFHLIFKFILSSFAKTNQELCGIPKTNTTSYINYSSIKKKEKGRFLITVSLNLLKYLLFLKFLAPWAILGQFLYLPFVGRS